MHEMSLIEGVVRILEDQAATHGFTSVKTVWMEIGELSNVDPDSLLFCFDAVTRGSAVASEAKLEIIRIPGQGFCMNCGESVPVRNRYDPCPKCAGFGLKVTAGDEMRIKELEVE